MGNIECNLSEDEGLFLGNAGKFVGTYMTSNPGEK
jgi:hypothetical protein